MMTEVLIIHDTWYGGAPTGLNALALCKDVFEERGSVFTPPRVHDTNEDPDSLFERGNQLRIQYLGTQSASRPVPPTEAERAFSRLTRGMWWCVCGPFRGYPIDLTRGEQGDARLAFP